MKNNGKQYKIHAAWLSALAVTVMTGALLVSGCGNNATVSNDGGSPVLPAPTKQPAGQGSGNGNGNGTSSNGNSGNNTGGTTPPAINHPIDTAHNNYHGSSVYFQNENIGFVGGDGFIFRTTDGGKTWSQQWNGSSTILSYSFPTVNVGYAFGMKSNTSPPQYTIYGTQDDGVRWAALANFNQSPAQIHFISAQVGFVSNQMTTDGGMTWQTLPVPSNTSQGSAYFDDPQNGYAVTTDNNGFQIVRTTNGGKSWQTTLSKSGPINRGVIDSTSPEDAWVLLYGGSGMTQTSYSLFHTQDGGQHWTTVLATATAGGGPAPGFPNETDGRQGPLTKPGQLEALDSQTAYLLGVCPACEGIGAISIGGTKDGGKSWTNYTAKWPGQDADVSFVDGNHGWVLANGIGYGSVLYETKDGGQTWGQEFVFGKSGVPQQ